MKPGQRGILIAILCAALLIRVIAILALDIIPTSDAREYDTLARNLAEGRGYTVDERPTAYRPPGYPLFLAAVYRSCGNGVVSGQIAQAFLETLICLLLCGLGRLICSPAVGLVAAGLWAFFPVSIVESNLLMSESIFTCFLLLSLYVLASPRQRTHRHVMAAGAIWGAMALIKPFFILAPLIFGVREIAGRKSLRRALRESALLLLCVALVAAPWLLRNLLVFHAPVLSTNGGVNFWIGNNESANGSYRVPPEGTPMDDLPGEVARDRAGWSLGARFIASHPGKYLLLAVKKLAYLFSSESPIAVFLAHPEPPPGDARYAQLYVDTPIFFHIAVNIHYVFFIIAGIAGLLCAPPALRDAVRTMLLIVTCWVVVHLVFFGSSRFHYPLLPFFVLPSAYWVGRPRCICALSPRRKLVLLACVLCFLSILLAEILTGISRSL
jgi:4-amino-4-deoxy-L-arabinose transferase-like glycosyltransferase